MTDYEETEEYEPPFEEADVDEDSPELSEDELAYLAQAWEDSQGGPEIPEEYHEPQHGWDAGPGGNPESAVITRIQLADQAERQIRSEFPGLPEGDVERIRNAFFDTRYSSDDLAASFQGKTHLAYAALAYQEASKSGRLRGGGSAVPGRSPIAGVDMQSGIPAEDRPTYEKWVQAFGKAYTVNGQIDHKLARRRFKEALG